MSAMEYYAARKKRKTVIAGKVGDSGDCCVEWKKPGSKRQMLEALPNMWNPKRMTRKQRRWLLTRKGSRGGPWVVHMSKV